MKLCHQTLRQSSRLPSDWELMGRMGRWDQMAFNAVYQRYQLKVLQRAFDIGQNRQTAEEVTQDVFLKLWDRAPDLPQRTNLLRWLMRSTWYMGTNQRRQEQQRLDQLSDIIVYLSHEMQGNLVSFSLWEDSLFVRMMIDALSPGQAQAIQLSFLEGESHQAIATQLHIPLGTVKTRIRAGLMNLRINWDEAQLKA